MTSLLTATQMRHLEKTAAESGEVTWLELMERAGQGVFEAIFEEWPELKTTTHKAVVLCGPGNNGGDGFVVARLLKQHGWTVEVFLFGDPEKLPPSAKVNYERWREIGECKPLVNAEFDGYATNHPDTKVVIDALFGSGLTRPIKGLGHVQDELNYYQAAAGKSPNIPYVVSIDVPSGLCSDSGKYLQYENENPFDFSIMANLTVTFQTPYIGHYIASGPSACGRLRVKSLDFEVASDKFCNLIENTNLNHVRLDKGKFSHKYQHGHAIMVSGPSGKTGAIRLAARGALRVGAGLVTIAANESAIPEHAAHLNAIMLSTVNDSSDLRNTLNDERINAICIGPALSYAKNSKEMIQSVLKTQRKTVLDADAIGLFSENPEELFDSLHNNVVLTPHSGEFSKLFPDILEKLNHTANTGPAYSKADATKEAAFRAGCVVLFKGKDTVIADPLGNCAINSAEYDRSSPWLATAGSGDVLAGMITGLMARGFEPMQAAETATWLHTECALHFGPGLIAEDLPEQIPHILKRILM